MFSFKLKLVLYFLLLSLLPLIAAFAGFSALEEQSQTRLADARLQGGLRGALAAYGAELDMAEDAARALAISPPMQRALAAGDAGRVRALLGGNRSLVVTSPGGLVVGDPSPGDPRSDVAVIGSTGRRLGTISAVVARDPALLRRLRGATKLDTDLRLVLVSGGGIVASEDGLTGGLGPVGPKPAPLQVDGKDFRGLAVPSGDEPNGRLAVLISQAVIDAANRTSAVRVLGALLLALLLVASVAYLQGRAVVATIRQLVDAARGIASGRLSERVPVKGRDELALLARSFNEMAEQLEGRVKDLENERRRLREATNRFGEALAASHDIAQLLRVIVETAVEATRATGGVLVGPGGEEFEVGAVAEGAQHFELPLSAGTASYGRLLLAGESFSIQDVETASILVGHAVIALENARLHAIVEHQALVDGLTGLANRRQAESSLAAELQRVERLGGTLGVVLADLDDFKRVNDVNGHAAGDAVLVELGRVLTETVREIDTCARWGGEEFLILLPGTDADGAARLAERIRAALEERLIITPDGRSLRVTASLGVAATSGDVSAVELVAAADTALYAAKRRGKNVVVSGGARAGRT